MIKSDDWSSYTSKTSVFFFKKTILFLHFFNLLFTEKINLKLQILYFL